MCRHAAYSETLFVAGELLPLYFIVHGTKHSPLMLEGARRGTALVMKKDSHMIDGKTLAGVLDHVVKTVPGDALAPQRLPHCIRA